MAPNARIVLPQLIDALACERPFNNSFLSALLAIDPGANTTATIILARTRDGEEGVRFRAALCLQALTDIHPQAALEGLSTLLHDHSDRVRAAAIKGLTELGPKASSIVPALIDALHDESPDVPQAAIIALQRIGPEARTAVIPLCYALKDRSTRGLSVWALTSFDREDVQPGVPILLHDLHNCDPDVRLMSAYVLVASKSESESTVTVLSEILLHCEESNLRGNAAGVLRMIGPDAKAVLTALVLALKDEDGDVRSHAAAALVEIDPKAACYVPKQE